MAKNNEAESSSINLLGAGTVVNGDIKTSGDFRIDGTLIGSINSKGRIIIGETGNVEGEIVCRNADISGIVKAKLIISELLKIKASAKINGEVKTNKLAIEPGAVFTGSCNMGETGVKNQKSPPKNETEKIKENIRKDTKGRTIK